MASAMPPMDWVRQPATPPRQDDQEYPPKSQWWPPTEPAGEHVLLGPPGVVSPPFSPFSAFSEQPPSLTCSQFLQPFLQASMRPPYQAQNKPQLSVPQPPPFHTPYLSPFALAQPSPGVFSPPPSNPHSSPSPTNSLRNSPHPFVAQTTGVLKRNSFLKLPSEVRAAIYQELVPEAPLHVTMDPISGKMFSYACQQMGDAEYVGRHWFAMSEPEYRKLASTPRECGHLACVQMGPRMRGLGRDERGLVSLLMSCRAIHDELAPYLYARPKLMFNDVATLRRFLETADTIQLRHYVRNLSIAYLVPERPQRDSNHHYSSHHVRVLLKDWIRVWQGIALMDGLRHLHVSLVARGAFANHNYQVDVMGPMMLLKGKRKKDGRGGKLRDFDVVSFEGTRQRPLPEAFRDVPYRYVWRAWSNLAGPDLERVARRYKQFVDAQPPYWHHLSSYRQHSYYRGDFSMRSLYSVM